MERFVPRMIQRFFSADLRRNGSEPTPSSKLIAAGTAVVAPFVDGLAYSIRPNPMQGTEFAEEG